MLIKRWWSSPSVALCFAKEDGKHDLRHKFQNNQVFKLFGPPNLNCLSLTLSTSPLRVCEEPIMQTETNVCMHVLYVCVSGSVPGTVLRGCFSEHLSSTMLKLGVTFKLTLLPCLESISFGNGPAGTQQCLLCRLLLAIAKASHLCPRFSAFEHIFWLSLKPDCRATVSVLTHFGIKTAQLLWTQAQLHQTVVGSSFNLWNICLGMTLKSLAKQMQTCNMANAACVHVCEGTSASRYSLPPFTCFKMAKAYFWWRFL